MPAIDLLFDVKPSSERLHQMVLGALLVRTELLLELGAQAPAAEAEYDWEPRGGDFDLRVKLKDGSSAWFELKVDREPDSKQVTRQIDLLEDGEHDNDRIFYFLLGISQFHEGKIDTLLAEREHGVARRVRVYTSESLSEALEGLPIAETLGGHGGDARSLASAYRALLKRLDHRHSRFQDRDPDDWTSTDLYGLYHSFTERISAMESASVGYAPTPAGGRMVCWWDGRSVAEKPKVRLYPQWEIALGKESGTDTRLCFKISVQDDNSELRSRLRDAAWEAIQSAASEDRLNVNRPERFGHGEHMTVAIAAPRPVTEDGIDWDLAERCAMGGERIIETADLESAVPRP